MRSHIFPAAIFCLIALATPLSAQQPAAIPVGTVAAELRPVTKAAEFVGRVEAIERVGIRARITGYLQDVLFTEGDVVKAGDVLYKIEPETFQAAAQQAQGALLQAQGNLANASVQLNRTQELVKSDTASRALLDERTANQKDAQGAVIIADANLKTANVNLSYTQIVAPITGKIGRSKLTVGNVVSPDTGVLTEIVSQDPMYVTFPVSQREFLHFREAEELKQVREKVAVRIRFSDGSLYDQLGRINFVDVTVDKATDTVLVRATIANPRGVLIDGQLVRVSLESDRPDEKVLIPQSALIVDQQGLYVFVVEDGKAAIRRVKAGGESGASAIIDDGIKPGEQVVVQGMESLRPGTPVIASPVPPPPAAGG